MINSLNEENIQKMENFLKQDNTDLHFMRYDFTGNLREPLARLGLLL